MNVNPLTRLRFFIIDYYDLAAFQLLCHDLSIRYDLLGGDNRLDVKADRLLHQIGQKRRFGDLLSILHITRQDAYEQNKLDDLTAGTLMDAFLSFLEEHRGETDLSMANKGSMESRKSDRYQIQEELGRGSFAVVYKALDMVLKRTVALKILHPHMRGAPEAVARFKFEAQIAGNLRHPNIIRVEDFGYLDDERLFLAMDYLPGRTLQNYLNEHGVLSLEQAVFILEQVASALDYAHEQGVIHRDLKPANIMLEETADRLKATLTDFGLVKAVEGSMVLTMQAAYLGTMEYMAPEQADINRQAEVGPATDRYALGVLSYRLLTGQVPFPGNSWAVMGAIINNPPPPPRNLRSEIPEYTESALLKMLAKVPHERFDSCMAFVAALSGPPPPGPNERLVALYEQILQAAADEDWMEVLILGGQIRGIKTGYRDVTEYISRARKALSLPYESRKTQRSRPEVDIISEMEEPEMPTGAEDEVTMQIPDDPDEAMAWLEQLAADQGASLNDLPSLTDEEMVSSEDASTVAIPDDPDEAMAWLEQLAANQGASLDELPSLTNEEMEPSENDDIWVNPKTGKEMVRVPPGPFLFGWEKEKRELSEFWIDKTPVTNAEYARFVAETSHRTPDHWQDKKEPPPNHPVEYISWADANAYAAWAEGSLPSEEQWEKAARGTDGRAFPWGDEWQDGHCNTSEAGIGKTTPVDRFSPIGDSPYGCVDMSGNVGEWAGTEERIRLKGGSYEWDKKNAHTAASYVYYFGRWVRPYGIRVVVEAPSTPSAL